MLKRNFGVLLLVSCLITTTSLAQTVDEIIAKHVEALGGLEKIQAIESMKITGTATRGGMGIETQFTRFMKRPNLLRTETQMRGQTMIQAYDGENAWAIMPFGGDTTPQQLTEQRAQRIIQDADFDGPLVDYKTKGSQIKLIGKEEFEGTEVYKLEVTRKNGDTFSTFLDAEYFLEIKRVMKRTGRDGNEFETETQFSDFKPVNGVMIAHSITTKGGGFGGRSGGRGGRRGGGSSVMTFESIEVNVEIADDVFKMPATAEK